MASVTIGFCSKMFGYNKKSLLVHCVGENLWFWALIAIFVAISQFFRIIENQFQQNIDLFKGFLIRIWCDETKKVKVILQVVSVETRMRSKELLKHCMLLIYWIHRVLFVLEPSGFLCSMDLFWKVELVHKQGVWVFSVMYKLWAFLYVWREGFPCVLLWRFSEAFHYAYQVLSIPGTAYAHLVPWKPHHTLAVRPLLRILFLYKLLLDILVLKNTNHIVKLRYKKLIIRWPDIII